MLRIASVVIALLALPALAEGTPGVETVSDTPKLGDIPPDEWRSMTRGRTVTYLIGTDLWAREAYSNQHNGVLIRMSDGTCLEGIWTWTDGEYCFDWSSGEFSCFRHVRTEDGIMIIPVVDGVEMGTVQTVDSVSDAPVSCGPVPVS